MKPSGFTVACWLGAFVILLIILACAIGCASRTITGVPIGVPPDNPPGPPNIPRPMPDASQADVIVHNNMLTITVPVKHAELVKGVKVDTFPADTWSVTADGKHITLTYRCRGRETEEGIVVLSLSDARGNVSGTTLSLPVRRF